MNTKQFTFSIPDDLKKYLRKIADENYTSMAKTLLRLIAEERNRNEREN